MKNFILLILLVFVIKIVLAYKKSSLIEKRRIKEIKEDIQFTLREMDKQFEQINKRPNFLENLSLIIIAGLISFPFLIEYLARKRSEMDRKKLEEAYKTVLVLKELSKYAQK